MIIEGFAFKFKFFTISTKIRPVKGCLFLTAMIMVLFIVGCSRCSAPKVQPTISIVPTAEIPLSLVLPEKGPITVHFGFDSQIADKIKDNPEYSSILDKLKDPQTGKVPEILLKELMNFSVTSNNSNGQALGDAFRDMLTKGAIQKVSTQDLVIDIDHDPKVEGKGSLHIRKITPGETLLILSKYNLGNTSDYSVVMTGDIKMNGANGSIFLSSCQLSDITAPGCSGNRESSTSISSAEWSKVQTQVSSHSEDKSTVLCLGILLSGVGEAWIDNIVLSGRVTPLTPKPSTATESHEGTQTSKMPITIRFNEASFKSDQISSVSW